MTDNISPIQEIDRIILLLNENRNKFSLEEKEIHVEQFIKSVLAERETEYEVDGGNPLFNEEISLYNKGIVAIYLLRLWSADESIFENFKKLERGTLKLLEQVKEQDRNKLKELTIKPSEQTFEKVNKIKDFVKIQEDKIRGVLGYYIDSLEGISTFKNTYLSQFRNTAIKQLIAPFLPKDINAKVDNIFLLVKSYSHSSTEEKSSCFGHLEEALTNLLKEESEWNTLYSNLIIKDTFTKILSTVRKDFSNSPFSKPADLVITPANKKYPFSQNFYDFRISMVIDNQGSGHAYNVEIEVDEFTAEATFDKIKKIGTIGLNKSLVEFNCRMIKPAKDAIAALRISWENFDKSTVSKSVEVILDGQRDDINWESLKLKDFYSIEAVDTEDELVGRREILNYLISRSEGRKIGSAYIYGQRRVGKSSIVKTLKTKLEKLYPKDVIVFYQETGEYKDPDPNRTIDQLAKNICFKIKSFDPRIAGVNQPEFRGALSPLTGYLDEVTTILPNSKIIIILDEFDKIPVELYRKGQIGDAFFDTIRAISNKGPYGFLLVGGERMEYIMRDQSQEVNKFKSIRVDYFDKKTNWSDFTDLVVKPIEDFFEITNDAIEYLYDQTAGNPFFTKVICEELITLMVGRRDNFITRSEVIEATEVSVANSGEQIFAHFWRDGIRDILVNEEEVTANRRKVLISIINVLKAEAKPSSDSIIDYCVQAGIQETIASSTLKEFIDRDVLVSKDHIVSFKVEFFKRWLLRGGIEKLKTTLVESDRLDHEKMLNDLAKIKSQELLDLVNDWSTYRGKEITTDKVRSWLDQFGDNKNQRLVFKLLQNIHFYTDYEIRIKMNELFRIINKSIIEAGNVRTIKGKESTRKDIVVSYLEDSPAKSGAEYAKIFADENKIFHKNVVSPERLWRFLSTNTDVHSIIFVDDFLGTGNSAYDNLIGLKESFPELFLSETIQFHLGVVCGFQEAKQRLITRLRRQKVSLNLHLTDILDDSDKVFDDLSKVFSSPSERHAARAICYSLGSSLVKNNPLGYGNSQVIVVFPNTIPNNSLPILWTETKDWRPLFPRPM